MTEKRLGFAAPTRRAVLLGAAALGGTLIVPARVRAQTGTPRSGGVLRVSMPYNPGSLDPITGRNNPDFNAVYAIFDALLDFDPITLEVKPGLAKAWTFTDATTLVLDLEEGVEFHDGTPFNAEAVVFNIDRCLTHPRSNVKSDLTGVSKVEATGPYQVSFRLSQPNAALPASLSNRAGCMVSPASIQAAAEGNVDRAPVGTGPFKFVEWRDNDLIKVEKNPNYYRAGLPYLDGIDFRIINELNTAARTVTAGQADLAINMLGQQIVIGQRTEGLVTGATPSNTIYTAFLNYATEPLSDLRIRQAMNYALDREELNRVLLMGFGEPTCGINPKAMWSTDPSVPTYYAFDPDRSRALLAEAGHPNGIEIDTWSWPDQAAVQRQELISSQLAKAGIRLRVTPAPPAQAMQNFLIDKKGSMLISPTGGLPDPALVYERTFAANALRNAGKIELPGFRDLMNAAQSTLEPEARKAALHALDRYVAEQALHMPQFMSASMWIATPKVKDFVYGTLTAPKFHTVWLEA